MQTLCINNTPTLPLPIKGEGEYMSLAFKKQKIPSPLAGEGKGEGGKLRELRNDWHHLDRRVSPQI